MSFKSQTNRISELTIKKLEGGLSVDEQKEFASLLSSSSLAVHHYNEIILLYSSLATPGKVTLSHFNISPSSQQLDDLLVSMSQTEKEAPALERIQAMPVKQEDIPVSPPRDAVIPRINKTSLLVAITSLAALILMISYVSLNPHNVSQVATLTDSLDAQWAVGYDIRNGYRVTANSESVRLQGGAVKVVTDKGVELVLEGPAEFQFDSVSQMRLLQGRLYVKVSPRGNGFSVDTPNAKIIDLGTEFGVGVDEIGNSMIQMHKGKASLVSGYKGKTPNTLLMLTEGQSGRVSSQTGEFKPTTFDQQAFLQGFNSEKRHFWRGENKINLADIIGGGNGFGTGRYGIQIDTHTGQMGTLFSMYPMTSNNKYIRVTFSPFIDGLFVPDNKKGGLNISSMQDLYTQCPETQGNFWGHITNGPWQEGNDGKTMFWTLNGISYGTKKNPAVYLHPNKGITFDLQALRDSISPLRVIKFVSLCGISETAMGALRHNDELPIANFYVLIDGQERFRKDDVRIQDGAIPIDIEIKSQDRFLTLMTTNGSDGKTRWDWCLFAEPYLHIEPK